MVYHRHPIPLSPRVDPDRKTYHLLSPDGVGENLRPSLVLGPLALPSVGRNIPYGRVSILVLVITFYHQYNIIITFAKPSAALKISRNLWKICGINAANSMPLHR